MAFTPDFTATQPEGEPSVVTLTDTSSGTVDPSVTERRVYITDYEGNALVPDGTTTAYVVWPLADLTIDIDCLDKDYATDIRVDWVNSGGTAISTKSKTSGFTSYNEDFDYTLTQRLSGNPLLVDDNNFFNLKSNLRTEIDSGDQAILMADDIAGAQQCYDRATDIRINADTLFNVFSSS